MRKRTRTISIASGKGGVGKTTLTANLAACLAGHGSEVLVFDGDLGLANVDIFFGVRPEYTMHDLLRGAKDMNDIITPVMKGVDLVPGGSGIYELAHLNAFQRRSLIEASLFMNKSYDFMLIDSAPGISDGVLHLNSAAEECLVVITPDPASLTDAYAMIKILNQKYRVNRFSVVCNLVSNNQEGISLFHKFSEVIHRFLFVGLDLMGVIPADQALRHATLSQKLIVESQPESAAATAIEHIAFELEKFAQTAPYRGGVAKFWEQAAGLA